MATATTAWVVRDSRGKIVVLSFEDEKDVRFRATQKHWDQTYDDRSWEWLVQMFDYKSEQVWIVPDDDYRHMRTCEEIVDSDNCE